MRGRADPHRRPDGRDGHHRRPAARPTTTCAASCTTSGCRRWRSRVEHHPHGGRGLAVGAAPRRARWSRSATPRPRCSTCWRCSSTAAPRPAAIVGCPVGFIGAAESKQALARLSRRPRHRRPVRHRARSSRRLGDGVVGRQRAGPGGGVMHRPLLRRRPRPRRPRADHPQGRAADRVGRRGRLPRGRRQAVERAPHRRRPDPGRRGRGGAALPGHHGRDRPPGRVRRRDGRLLRGVGGAAGRAPRRPGATVVLLAEGDPLFYGSYMYMHDRLAERFPTEVVPGVPVVRRRDGGRRRRRWCGRPTC